MYRTITPIHRLVLGLLICMVLFSAADSLSAEQRFALADFVVHSDNPKFTYLGKGISEMIAVELMEEMEFALSSLAEDTDTQVEVGKMLAADYLVFGEIVDMAPQLLISVRVTGIESGEVVFRDTLTEKAGSYEYISGYFAAGILGRFEVKVAESTEQKTAEKVEKDEEAVVAFSRAIDAYDRDEKQEAKAELKVAKRIDPEYEAATIYLSKLETISPKFRVETDYYAPTINPAYLGFLTEDMFYLWGGGSFAPPDADEDGYQPVEVYLLKEFRRTARIGYSFCLGPHLGISAEYEWTQIDNWINAPFQYDVKGTLDYESRNSPTDQRISMGAGYLISDDLSAGTSIYGTYTVNQKNHTTNVSEEGFSFGGTVAFVYTLSAGKYIGDLQLSWDSKHDWYLDEEEQKFESGTLPLILDGTFVASFLDDRVVGALKGIGDIYTDSRGGHAMRIIPIVEYWVFPFLSLRRGYEYVHLQQAGTFTIGHGFLGGFSAKVGKFTGNLNYTLRKKPSRQIPGYLIEESFLLCGFNYTPGWVTRN